MDNIHTKVGNLPTLKDVSLSHDSREAVPQLILVQDQTVSVPKSTVDQEAEKDILNGILYGDDKVIVHDTRELCAFTNEHADVAKRRTEGWPSPDASDRCIAALTHQARDGDLLGYYRELVTKATGSPANAESLPSFIGDALVKNGKLNVIDMGPGNKRLNLTPGLALDAGFVNGYLAGDAAREAAEGIDPAKLKVATEAVYTQQGDRRQAYGIGYIQGAGAYQAAHSKTASNGRN